MNMLEPVVRPRGGTGDQCPGAGERQGQLSVNLDARRGGRQRRRCECGLWRDPVELTVTGLALVLDGPGRSNHTCAFPHKDNGPGDDSLPNL